MTGTTSVHSKETTVQRNLKISYRQYLELHQPKGIRESVELYLAWDAKAETKKTETLFKCRTYAWFARETSTGHVKILSNACRLRWCPLCQAARAKLVTINVQDWLIGKPAPKLITLTLRHSPAALDYQIKSLYGFFRSLRRSKQWKNYVSGGIWFFQLTQNPHTNEWHPHLHVLAESSFFPHPELSALWDKITGGSFVVDIRILWNPDLAAQYVARYVARPTDLTNLSIQERLEVAEACEGLRLAGTFGTGKSVRLTNSAPKTEGEYRNLGSWGQLLEWSKFDENAQAIVSAWQNDTCIDETCTCDHISDFLANAANWQDFKLKIDPPLPLLWNY